MAGVGRWKPAQTGADRAPGEHRSAPDLPASLRVHPQLVRRVPYPESDGAYSLVVAPLWHLSGAFGHLGAPMRPLCGTFVAPLCRWRVRSATPPTGGGTARQGRHHFQGLGVIQPRVGDPSQGG